MKNLEDRVRRILNISYEVRQIPYVERTHKQNGICARVEALLGELGNRLEAGFYAQYKNIDT